LVPDVDWTAALGDAWSNYERHFVPSKSKEHGFHNLPRPDFDRFIGRAKELEDLRESLNHHRHWIISIEGIGGVGKSALALYLAWEMEKQMEQGQCPWKYIIWVSAKEDRLLPNIGIESIEPDFRVLKDLFKQILLVMGFPEYADADQKIQEENVATLLESEPCLLFIDNFETVRDPSVYNYLNDLPGSSLSPIGHKVILTSREQAKYSGIWVRLEGLSDPEARKLVKQVAREFNVADEFHDQRNVDRVLADTGNIPLALRWVVGQVSLGRTLASVLARLRERTEDIHRFCFEATAADLDEDKLKILFALSQLPGPVHQESIAEVTGFDRETVDTAMTTLRRSSLVNLVKVENRAINLYNLLPLTRTFCAGLGSRWQEYANGVARAAKVETKRQDTVQVAAEIFDKVQAHTNEERIAVTAVMAAEREHRAGNTPRALQMLENAKALARNLGPIYLAEAIILADQNDPVGSRKAFNKAAELSPSDPEAFKEWGKFELSCQRYSDAIVHLDVAASLDMDDCKIPYHLAQAFKLLGDIERRQHHKPQATQYYLNALTQLKRAIIKECNSNTQKAHNVLCYQLQAETNRFLDRNAEVLKACREGLKLDPNHTVLRMLMESVTTQADMDSAEI
jgi:tetratricopeptide (TPR) repeat protein